MELSLSNRENEKLGKFENLTVSLPLFNPNGKSKVPLPVSDKALTLTIISKLMKFGRDVWEEDDDEEIEGKLRTAIVQVCFMDDVFPAGSPEHTFILKSMLTSMTNEVTDDMAKASEEYEVDIGYKHFVKRQSLIVRVMAHGAAEKEVETARLLFPAAATPIARFTNTTRESELEIPNLLEKLSQGNDEMMKRMSAVVLAFESEEWEEETLNEIQSFSTTMGPILEIIVGLRNVKIQGSIRESYLFQRLINRFTILSRALYNLTHLKEDLEFERVRGNTLLRIATSNGTPLQEVIQAKVAEMKSILRDIKVIGRKLEKTYPADENVFEYLEIMQTAWDAQLLSLPYLPQFQHLKPKLIE